MAVGLTAMSGVEGGRNSRRASVPAETRVVKRPADTHTLNLGEGAGGHTALKGAEFRRARNPEEREIPNGAKSRTARNAIRRGIPKSGQSAKSLTARTASSGQRSFGRAWLRLRSL